MYNAYQQYLSGIRQQEQVQRHHRDGEQSPVAKKPRGEPEYSEVWDREKMGLVRPDRPESAAVQQQYANSAGNQLNESRSTVIADYRRSTIAIEGTTAETTESTGAYTSTVNDYRAVKELHANFKREAQRSSEDRAEISADRAKSIRTDHFSKFFAEATRKFGISASRTFERVSDEFEYRFRSEANNPQRATTFGPQRDREANQATNREDHQENGLSRAISRQVSGFNTGSIFKALDVIDRRKELELRQRAERSSRLDFDM
jgi:hypothetical protein